MSNEISGINYKAAQLGDKQQLGGETVKNKDKVDLKDGLSQAELEAIDTNKDGLVTEEEFNAAMEGKATREETQAYWLQYLSAYNEKNQKEHKVVTETIDQATGKMTGYNVKQYNEANNLLIRETNVNNGTVTESALTGSGMRNSKVLETKSDSILGESLVTIDNSWNRIRNVQHPGEPKIDIGGISYIGDTISQVTINGVTYSGSNISAQEANGNVTIKDNNGKTIAIINHNKGQLSSIQLDFSESGKAQTSISFNTDGSIKEITTYDANGAMKTKASATKYESNETAQELLQNSFSTIENILTSFGGANIKPEIINGLIQNLCESLQNKEIPKSQIENYVKTEFKNYMEKQGIVLTDDDIKNVTAVLQKFEEAYGSSSSLSMFDFGNAVLADALLAKTAPNLRTPENMKKIMDAVSKNLWGSSANVDTLATDIENALKQIAPDAWTKDGIKELLGLVKSGNTIAGNDIKALGIKVGAQYKETQAYTPVEIFNNWTNSLNPTETFQYVELGESEQEFTANVLKFAEDYIKKFGNGETMDFAGFMKLVGPGLDEASAKAIFDLIDMDHKGTITAKEYASYILAIDHMDGNANGNISIENYNDFGAFFAVYADEQYAAEPTTALHEQAKIGLEMMKEYMTKYHNKYFTEPLSATTAAQTIEYAQSSFGNMLNILAGKNIPDSVMANLINELLPLKQGASKNIDDIPTWVNNFAQKYNLDNDTKQAITTALTAASYDGTSGTLSKYDIGRLTTAFAILSSSDTSAITTQNLNAIMKLIWDHQGNYSKMADEILKLGINAKFSKEDLIEILKAGDTNSSNSFTIEEQGTVGDKTLDKAAKSFPTEPASSTPASSTPASSTPASSTPASSTPASSTPASSTPASSTPASSTPAPQSPAAPPTTPLTATTAAQAITNAEGAFGDMMKILSGSNLSDEVLTNLVKELQGLKQGASGNINNVPAWVNSFAQRYNLDSATKQAITNALNITSHNGTLSVYDFGRLTTTFALLSNSDQSQITADNISKLMGLIWDNRGDYSKMADEILKLISTNYSKEDLIAIIKAGDTNSNQTFSLEEQKSIGDRTLNYSAKPTTPTTPTEPTTPTTPTTPTVPETDTYDRKEWESLYNDLYMARTPNARTNAVKAIYGKMNSMNLSSTDVAKVLLEIRVNLANSIHNQFIDTSGYYDPEEEWKPYEDEIKQYSDSKNVEYEKMTYEEALRNVPTK